MAAQYPRSGFYLDIQSNAGVVNNIERLANRAVRYVIGDIDLRSTKRRAYISPYLNEEQFDYQSPSDLKEWAIVDVRRIVDRTARNQLNMATSEYFDRNKSYNLNLIAIEDNSFLQKLRISADLEGAGSQATISNMDDDSSTDGGTWAVGGSGSNLTIDTGNYVEGSASLNFDASATYTSITLTNSTFTAVDLTGYQIGGAVYMYVWIPSTTGLTSFKLRVGTNSSNYYEKTITTTNENLAFAAGWNLLRMEFSAATQTGTVTMSSIGYARLEIVGDGTAAATTDWRADFLAARQGLLHEVWYYTKYGWQTSAGAYIENSTATTDLINCDTEEYELFILKAKEMVSMDLKQFTDMATYNKMYEIKKVNYLSKYPSERLLTIMQNWNFGSDYNLENSNDTGWRI